MAKKRTGAKICASIVADSLEAMAQKGQNAFVLEADLVEFRIDTLAGRVTVEEIASKLGDLVRKSILTVRPGREGGKFLGSELERMGLISRLTELKPAYVDVELSTAAENEKWFKTLSKRTEKIISWHDLKATPDLAALRGVCRQELEIGAIAKVVTTATSFEDNARTLRLCGENPGRTVSFCMGELGVTSRVMSMQMGAPIAYAALSQEAVAPGQLPIETMAEFRGLIASDD